VKGQLYQCRRAITSVQRMLCRLMHRAPQTPGGGRKQGRKLEKGTCTDMIRLQFLSDVAKTSRLLKDPNVWVDCLWKITSMTCKSLQKMADIYEILCSETFRFGRNSARMFTDRQSLECSHWIKQTFCYQQVEKMATCRDTSTMNAGLNLQLIRGDFSRPR